jgi:redox-sensitive bicupin YhaK (pirin superfamily)
MITIRAHQDRGHADHGWLDTRHTFSFANYFDPQHMGYSVLRVINDDRVAPGQGFGTHPHQDMEIVSIVLAGVLEHKDSMGNGTQIRPGDVQRMSAGTGVVHSEFNGSEQEPVHFLQIWILPAAKGIAPGYEQTHFPADELQGNLCLIVSPDGRDGSLTIHQDVSLYRAALAAGETVTHELQPGRRAYVHIAQGSARLNGQPLEAGDGARVQSESIIRLEGIDQADVLVFDLP